MLVVRMAEHNPRWGYMRIRGALKNLGHEIGRNTIRSVLREQGIDPAPERGKRQSWASFIKAHLGAIAGADFFTAEVVTLAGLVLDSTTQRLILGPPKELVRQLAKGWIVKPFKPELLLMAVSKLVDAKAA